MVHSSRYTGTCADSSFFAEKAGQTTADYQVAVVTGTYISEQTQEALGSQLAQLWADTVGAATDAWHQERCDLLQLGNRELGDETVFIDKKMSFRRQPPICSPRQDTQLAGRMR